MKVYTFYDETYGPEYTDKDPSDSQCGVKNFEVPDLIWNDFKEAEKRYLSLRYIVGGYHK